jgi:hypothetical protein
MGKKRSNPRPDAERRIRQSERIGRHLQVLRCIMGPGRWDAVSLAKELEVSERTIHRILQALTFAGVPWYFHAEQRCYRVRDGYKFPGVLEGSSGSPLSKWSEIAPLLEQVREDFESLRSSVRALEQALSLNNPCQD